MKKDDLKIYCKFNKNKETIDKVICKMFCDFAQKKNHDKNIELNSKQNEKDTLK